MPTIIKLRMSVEGVSNFVTINTEFMYMMPHVVNVVLPHKIKVTLLQKKNLAQRSIVICILVRALP